MRGTVTSWDPIRNEGVIEPFELSVNQRNPCGGRTIFLSGEYVPNFTPGVNVAGRFFEFKAVAISKWDGVFQAIELQEIHME